MFSPNLLFAATDSWSAVVKILGISISILSLGILILIGAGSFFIKTNNKDLCDCP